MNTIVRPHIGPQNIRPLDTKHRITKTELWSGILNGQVAGLLMVVVMMILFSVNGGSPIFPLQVVGSLAIGDGALQSNNYTAVVIGLILHQLGPALLWGILYGILAAKLAVRTRSEALMLGLGIGVIAMVGPYFLIPFLMTGMHGFDLWNHHIPMVWDWMAHLLFGASFVLYPSFFDSLKGKV